MAHRAAPYYLMFDNFFTGFPLLEKLSEISLYGTSTMHSNRIKKCPIDLIAMEEKEEKVHTRVMFPIWAFWNMHRRIITLLSQHPIKVELSQSQRLKRWSASDKKSVSLLT